MEHRGVVREWHRDEGWGVVDSEATPGGCWVHFSSLRVTGPRALSAGQAVSFEAERGWQDGYAFRAVAVWTGGDRPAAVADEPPSAAYGSSLVLGFDPEG
ncbi:cold shock domain-containing protein [Asanoa sp. NPDC050611]|uniref:cold-shock protein n=1 Tax=Asanoa sp. NPDC050611 TaxID=3157098 RepID=UPI0033CD30C1